MTREEAILALDSLSTWFGHERLITEEIVEAIKTLSYPSFSSNLDEESKKPIIPNDNLDFALDKYIGDLDEELQKNGCTYEFDWDDITETIREVGNYFARWQKEQMIKESVEGEVRKNSTIGYFEFSNEQQFHSLLEQFQDCDKVHIIIVKDK